MDEANIIKGILEEEYERNLRSQHVYEGEISNLPRGSLSVRKRGNQHYCYLKYRDGDKIVTAYQGRSEECESDLRKQIEQRKELENSLRRLKREQKYIEKALHYK